MNRVGITLVRNKAPVEQKYRAGVFKLCSTQRAILTSIHPSTIRVLYTKVRYHQRVFQMNEMNLEEYANTIIYPKFVFKRGLGRNRIGHLDFVGLWPRNMVRF